MANETRSRGRAVVESAVRSGAADAAPTAPHATPRAAKDAKKTGPERFWGSRRVRVALALCVVLSIAIHWWISPWTMRANVTFDVHDEDGELVIPVDIVTEEPTPPPPPEAPPPATPEKGNEEGPGARDAAPPPKKRDAGAPDAEARDAEARDAGLARARDAGELLASTDAGAGEGLDGAVAAADAGGAPGSAGPRDAVGMIGAAGSVQAGENLVTLLLNVEAMRAHPAAARLSKLARAAPGWSDALRATTVDPIRDADWLLISGPSLIHTERDIVLVRYSIPDAVADEAIDVIRRQSANGAAFDAGVPGVRATLGRAVGAPRVFMRPQTHLLAVVPPDFAGTAAKAYVKARLPLHQRAGEAMRLVLKKPGNKTPLLAKVTEVRLWAVPRADGGAEVFGEGDCANAGDAADTSATVNGFLSRYRGSMEGAMVNIASHGLLDTLEVRADGGVLRVHALANREQVDAVIAFLGAQLGVDLGPPPQGASAP